MNSKKEKVIVFFIGVFTIILLLEFGLRIVGIIHEKSITSSQVSFNDGKQDLYTILCLGDSYTVGVGVSQGKNYPNQLESLLRLRTKEKIVTVINWGLGGQNTTQLLNKLQYNINTIKPDLIILLTGGANYHNYYGYYTYLKGKSIFSVMLDHLYRIRIYKLIKLLSLNIKNKIKDKLSSEKLTNNNSSMDRYYNRGDLFYENSELDITDGWAYKDQRKYEEAIKWFKEGIKVDPGNSSNYTGIGEVYRKRGNYDYEEAIKWFKRGIKVDPGNSSNYTGIGEVYRDQRNYEEAIKWFKKGIKVDPGNSTNYGHIGWVYIVLRNYEEAIKWFKEGIKVDPGDSGNYNGIGFVYRDQRNYEEAIKWYKKAIKANPGKSTYYCGITQIYRETRGKYVEIMEFLRKTAKNNAVALNFIEILKRENIDQEIANWMKSDIKKIIKICQNKGIKIILQNYPCNPQSGDKVTEIIKEVAKEHSLPFVDNGHIFNELLNKGERREDYFTPDGHCNDKGYGIMAKNIYDKIIEEKILDWDDGE